MTGKRFCSVCRRIIVVSTVRWTMDTHGAWVCEDCTEEGTQ